jgi:hypothetical protein
MVKVNKDKKAEPKAKATKVELCNPYLELPAEYIHKPVTYPNHSQINIDLPFSAIVVGSMGAGKTQIVYNLFKNMACFTHVYLYVKDLDEPIYRFIIDQLETLGDKLNKTLVTYSSNIADVVTVEEFDKCENNLVVFDDLLLEKATKVKGQKTGPEKILDIYIRGRRQNASCIYVSQSYFDIPNLIRKNANYIFIKKVGTRSDLTRMVSEYQLSAGPQQIIDYYKASLKVDNAFFMVDLKSNNPDLKYRIGFKGIEQPPS